MSEETNFSLPFEAGATEACLPRVTEKVEDRNKSRGQWTRQLDFLLSLVGYCVGPGNLWRFPYLCNRNGGGAFLIPYFLCLLLIAIPIFFAEVAAGQFSGRGGLHVWSICPMFKGIGFTMTIVATVTAVYFNLIIAWVLYYLVRSFASVLPWTTCGNAWNTPACFEANYSLNIASMNNTSNSSDVMTSDRSSLLNAVFGDVTTSSTVNSSLTPDMTYLSGTGNTSRTMSAVEEFWHFNTLNKSNGLDEIGAIQIHMTLSMLGAWVLVFLCLIKGVKSVGKVVYVTAILPYILLVIFVVRTLMLPGAKQGVIFYITPDFSRLLDFQVWVEALLQIFYTVGMCWGGLITMASYNRFNNNCFRDSIFICLLGEGTSFFAGFAVFSVLGFMAAQMNIHVSEVVKAGPGLAFVAYPEALSQLPIPQLWAVMFFLMLLTIGLDSEFGMVETLVTALIDSFPHVLLKKRMLTTALICSVCFLIGLPLTFQGGVYIFQLLDWYVAVFNLMLVGLIECLVIGWIYGADRFGNDIELMLGRQPPFFIKILWRFVSPVLLLFGMVITAINYKPPTYGDYHYPGYAAIIGWSFALLPIVPVPVCMYLELKKTKGTIRQRLKMATSPDKNWFPKCPDAREKYINQ